MLKKILLSLTMIFVFCGFGFAAPLNLNEISDATCRITSNVGVGSGTVFSEDDQYYYILTNYHVIGANNTVKLEFFSRGWKTVPLDSAVVWKQYVKNSDVDFAILRINKDKFGNKKPRIIPLIPRKNKLKSGNYINGSGFPMGSGPQAWEGHVKLSKEGRIIFVPAPISGQSGSGILTLYANEQGELESRIGAILTWRIEEAVGQDKVVGGAISIDNLYALFDKKTEFTPQILPVSYKQVVAPNCSICNKPLYDHALGSDGKFYCVKVENGSQYIVGLPKTAIVRYWKANTDEIAKLYEVQCQGGSCPVPNTGGAMPFYGDEDGLFRRRQVPIPNTPRRNTPQQPSPQPTPANPYGVEPPDIPGISGKNTPLPIPEDKKIETKPIPTAPVPQDNSLADNLRKAADQIQALSVEKENLEKVNKELTDKLAEANISTITKVSQVVQNNPTTAVVGFGLGGILIYFLWKRVIKKIVVKQVDKVEDLIQNKVTEKWGEEAGKQARQVMDGADELILNFVDTFLEERRSANKFSKRFEQNIVANQRDKVADRLFPEGKVDNEALKAQLTKLLQDSQKTEIAEKDQVGIDLTNQLLSQVKDNLTVDQIAEIVKKVKEHEDKEKDTDVLAEIKALQDSIAALQANPVQEPAKV